MESIHTIYLQAGWKASKNLLSDSPYTIRNYKGVYMGKCANEEVLLATYKLDTKLNKL